jgi:hypothetical protein
MFASGVADTGIETLQGVHAHAHPWPKVANAVLNTRHRLSLVCVRLMNRLDGLPATSPSCWGGPHTLGRTHRMRMRAWLALLLVLFGAAASVCAQPPALGSCPVFPGDHIWNTPVAQLPVSPSSSMWVNTIGATSPLHPDFGSGTYNGGPIGIPYVTVPGTQPMYPATFYYASESDPGPYAIPLNAPIEGGSTSTGDRHVIAVDVDHCLLYEMYNAYPQTASWQADAGAIFNLLTYALRPETWTSADAAGLPIFAGLVRYDEILAGEIRHALRFTVPQTQGTYVWPARHEASSLTDSRYPPMGARFRLRANFDISSYSPTNQIILQALKTYGMMLADNGSAWFISGAPDTRWDNTDLHRLTTVKGSDFEAVDVAPLMLDPHSGQALQRVEYVTVTPAAASVPVQTTTQFTATVHNTADQTVTWDVHGTVGGTATVGWIDATGRYTAPAVVPSPATVVVHATSHAVPEAVGVAAVTIMPPPPPVRVTISPTRATVRITKTKQFTAIVQNTAKTAVTWRVSGVPGGSATVGIISASGLYKAPSTVPAPATVTVTATSVVDPTKSASAAVTIARR